MSKQTEIDTLLATARLRFFEGMSGRTQQPEYPASYLWRASTAVREAKALGATVTGADLLPKPGRVDSRHWATWEAVAATVAGE